MARAQTSSGAARLSILSNALLVVLKLVVGALTGSVSVISEAAHSAVDLAAAGIAFFSIRAAGRPADRKHPFGHGKFENLSAVVEAGLIFLAAAYIVYEAYHRLFTPHPLRYPAAAMAVMAVSAAVNWAVSQHLFRVAAAAGSPALLADAHHLRVDVWSSAGVFAALALVVITRQPLFDAIIALLVAGLIVKAAWGLTQEAGGGLLDVSLPAAETARLRQVLEAEPKLVGYHRVRARRSGPYRHIDLHLLFDPDISLREAHRLAEELEDRVRAALPNVSIVSHLEPATEEELAVSESEPGIWKGLRP